MRAGLGIGGVVVALSLAACSGSDATVATSADDGSASVENAPAPEDTYEVVGEDFAFSGVPEEVAPGAVLTFANRSDEEVHEMVVARIADGEILTVDELVALPAEEMPAIMWFQGTLVALPGGDGVVPGDTEVTSLVVEEPGQYLLLCLIPQGADPAVAEEALEAGDPDEPIDLGDGELHARLGMYARFDVAAP